MSEPTDPTELQAHYKKVLVRGVAAALALAVFSLAEYVIAKEVDNATWYMVPFMFAKGWIILDTFMHIRALRNDGAH